jgi:hypothetical protein
VGVDGSKIFEYLEMKEWKEKYPKNVSIMKLLLTVKDESES